MATISGNSYSSPKNINLKSGILRFGATKSSNPLTNDSTGAGIYINSSNQLIYWDKSTATTLGSAGSLSNFSLNDAYDDGSTITVDAGAITLAGSHATNNILALTLTGVGTGNVIDIQNNTSGTAGSDIIGTNNTWSVSSAGAAVFVGVTPGGDITSTAVAVDWDLIDNNASALSFDATGKAGIIAIVSTDSSEGVTMSGTLTVAGVLTASTGFASSNGACTITDNSNIANGLTITNNTVTTYGNASDAGVVEIKAAALTTGALVNLSLEASVLNGGFYVRCWEQTAAGAVFSVGEAGATAITGVGGSNVLTVTAGDISVADGSLTIVDADNATTVSVTNNTATTAAVLAVAGSGAFTGASFVTITPSGLTTGSAVGVTVDAITTGVAVKIANTGETIAAGELLQILNTESGDLVAKTGNLCSITSSLTDTGIGAIIEDYDTLLLSRSDIVNDVTVANAYTAQGSVLKILHTGTKTAGLSLTDTVIALEIESAGETTGTGDLVQLTNVGVGAITLDIVGAGVGADDVQINASGAHTNGLAGLHIKTSGALAAGGAAQIITVAGVPTADSRGFEMDVQKDMRAIYIDTDAATNDAIYITHSGNLAAGKAVMHITDAGIPAADNVYVGHFAFTGTATNESAILFADGDGKDVVGLYVDTDNTVAENSGNIVLHTSLSDAVGASIVAHQESATPAAEDQLLVINAYGEEATSSDTMLYAAMNFEASDVTDGAIRGQIKLAVADGSVGASNMRESLWLTDDTLALGDGEAFVLGSNGAQDLSISTAITVAGLTAAEPKIVLTDGSDGDITLTPGTTGLTRLIAGAPTVTAKTTTATLTVAEGGIITVTTAVAWIATLPAAFGNAGLWYTFKKTDAAANALTIDGSGVETIDGAATNATVDAQYDTMTIVCDGSNWHIIAKEIA